MVEEEREDHTQLMVRERERETGKWPWGWGVIKKKENWETLSVCTKRRQVRGPETAKAGTGAQEPVGKVLGLSGGGGGGRALS